MFPKSVNNLATVKTIQFIHSNHLQGSLVSRDYFFKGQSNEIFDPQYFHHSNQPGPQINGLNIFEFGLVFAEKFKT